MKHEYRRGDMVVFTSDKMHRQYPRCYPPKGTLGIVLNKEGKTKVYIQWEKGAIGWSDRSHVVIKCLTPFRSVKATCIRLLSRFSSNRKEV